MSFPQPGGGGVLPLPSSGTGITGATAATRFVGGTATGAPASGTFLVGDFVIDQTGKSWVCTVAGTPGTWANVGASAGVSTYNNRTGAVVSVAADTVARLDQIPAPTAAVALNAQNITGLANGVAAQDAAAFGQVPVPMYAVVSNTTAQTVITSTQVVLSWNTNIKDTSSFHSTSVNPTHLTVPKTGTYRVSANVEWNSPSVSARLGLTLRVNDAGNFMMINSTINAITGVDISSDGSMELSLNSGDYIELFVIQTSGVSYSLYGDGAAVAATLGNALCRASIQFLS